MDNISRWGRRVEEELYKRGRGAWIAAFVLGFIFFWPIGLAVLGYTIWRGRMGCWKHIRKSARRASSASNSPSNSDFDEYREETLRRLHEEQSEFDGFMERLRRAKDKAEFDQFMNDRQTGNHRSNPGGEPHPA